MAGLADKKVCESQRQSGAYEDPSSSYWLIEGRAVVGNVLSWETETYRQFDDMGRPKIIASRNDGM